MIKYRLRVKKAFANLEILKDQREILLGIN